MIRGHLLAILALMTLGIGLVDATKIALIYDVGGPGDKSFCDAAQAGLLKASEEFDFEFKELTPGQSTQIELALRRFSQQKYDLIIGVGFLFQTPMQRVAPDFPDVKYAIVDVPVDAPNVASLIFKAHEGAFLVGAIAGLKTTTNQIGFVGGMEMPVVQAFEAGFRAGIEAVNPEAKILVNYVGVTPEAFNNPNKGKELALAQYNKDVDIIFQAAGASGLGVLEAAEQTGKYIIWADANGNSYLPGQVLTSMIKGVELAVYQTIAHAIGGEFTGGIKIYGLKEQGVEFTLDEHNKPLLTPEILSAVEELKQKVIQGKIVVPSEPVNR